MKPKNFPERKRQRQLSALVRLPNTPTANEEALVLLERTAGVSRRSVRTKKLLAQASVARRERQGGKLARKRA